MIFVIPLLSAVLWAIVIIIDRVSLKKDFWTPSQALVMSSLLPFGGFLFLLAQGGVTTSLYGAVIAFLAGCCFTCSNALYFSLIRKTDEVDEIAAWDAAPPLLLGL